MNELDVFQEDKFQQAVKVAGTLAKSTIVPMHFRGKPEDVFACLVLGAELGFQPMQALNAIVMIQGNATLKAQTQMALCIGKIPDLKVVFSENISESKVSCEVSRGANSFKSTWDDIKAGAMGLLGKDNYKKQKMTMYRWRSCTEALRIICPDILMGINTTEEMIDVVPDTPETTLLEAINADADEMYKAQRKPEDSQFGPLFLMENGKHRGLRLHEICPIELEAYGDDLKKRKTQKTWEKTILMAIEDYLANMSSLYSEQITELNQPGVA